MIVVFDSTCFLIDIWSLHRLTFRRFKTINSWRWFRWGFCNFSCLLSKFLLRRCLQIMHCNFSKKWFAIVIYQQAIIVKKIILKNFLKHFKSISDFWNSSNCLWDNDFFLILSNSFFSSSSCFLSLIFFCRSIFLRVSSLIIWSF